MRVVLIVRVIVVIVVAVSRGVGVEVDRVELVGEREDLATLLLDGLEHIDEVLFQHQPVRDDQVGLPQRPAIAGGWLVTVGVDAGRHQRLDLGVILHQLGDDVREDRGRGDDPEAVTIDGVVDLPGLLGLVGLIGLTGIRRVLAGPGISLARGVRRGVLLATAGGEDEPQGEQEQRCPPQRSWE